MKIYIKYIFMLLFFQIIIGCSNDSIFVKSEIKQLNGKWSVSGGIASIEYIDGNQLKLTTETGLIGFGYLAGKNIVINTWSVTGRLEPSNNVIYWSNLTVWKRVNESK
jgi:hypothetical protein